MDYLYFLLLCKISILIIQSLPVVVWIVLGLADGAPQLPPQFRDRQVTGVPSHRIIVRNSRGTIVFVTLTVFLDAISEPRILHVPPVSIPDPKDNIQEDSESDKNNGPSGIPNYYSVGGDPSNLPVSELRRKLRRTICKAKNNPNYYRETLDD
jgi:hypothetical protein